MKINSSEYINKCRRDYSMFVLCHRALPSIGDGLISAARRIMWIMRNKNGTIKSATLAGAVLPLHPHSPPDDVVCNLAAPYGNNYPLLTGHGSFGTLLEPNGYGSTRYTSVQVSKFAKDVLYVDLNLVPLVPNYDNELEEPKHFLPLVPLCLVNPSFGLAVGYSSSIMPRRLNDIIDSQIKVLKGVSERKQPEVVFFPTKSKSIGMGQTNTEQDHHKNIWYFEGDYQVKSKFKVVITNLPFGIRHEKYRNTLQQLREKGVIKSFVDDSSSNYHITVTLARDFDSSDRKSTLEKLKLTSSVHENISLVDPEQTEALQLGYHQIIEQFTNWRLSWFVERYQRNKSKLENDLSIHQDIILAIQHKANHKASTSNNKETFKKWLKQIGVQDLEYISSLPTYRFTKEEKNKSLEKIKEIQQSIKECELLINSEDARKSQYIQELKEIKRKHGKLSL